MAATRPSGSATLTQSAEWSLNPITFGIFTSNGRGKTTKTSRAFLAMPILIGPVAEFHVTPPLAITLDAKFGPGFNTNDKIRFAMKIHAGAAYRF